MSDSYLSLLSKIENKTPLNNLTSHKLLTSSEKREMGSEKWETGKKTLEIGSKLWENGN